jgi:trehalose 6-phosphate phosphatase
VTREPIEALAERLDEAAIVLDLDGTLAPIVSDPPAARPLPAIVEPLRALTARARVVAIVTGRPSAFVRSVLDIAGVEIVGTYGLEDGPPVDPRVVAALRDAVDAAPGAYLEDKGVTVTVHFRNAAPPDGAQLRAFASSLGRDAGLEAFEGKQVIELAPPGPRKAGAVASVLARTQPAAAMYAGDDLEDLGGFAALDAIAAAGGPTLRVAVAGSETPGELLGAADLVVGGPAGLADLLVGLVGMAARGDVDVT